MAPPLYLALSKCEFAYEATNDEELSVEEGQLVWVLEDDDPDWYKVKIKTTDPNPGIGLVPASYLTVPTPLRTVRSVYDYTPAVNEAGELENEEELEIAEGEVLLLWEDEGDWVLVGREGAKGVGFVPGSYVESGDGEEAAQEETAPAPAAAPYVDPSERVAASKATAKPGNVKTWPVTEIDKKKKKKKGTLGVGNGAVFFASDSDKTPVQQYPISTLTDVTTEKSKHLHLTFPTIGELHFVISSPDTFAEIVAKIEEGRSDASSPPLTSPTAPAPAPPVASVYVPPPPPLRSNSTTPVTSHPPPPVRTIAAALPVASPVSNGNATALYDFDPEGVDELAVSEGDRLLVIEGGSDDPDWVKVRKVGEAKEGVVPASYIQLDDAADSEAEASPSDDEEARAAAEAEAAADAQDKARLAAELQAAERARRAKVAADREAKEKKAKEEAARRRRLEEQPRAAPIPVPEPGQIDDEKSSTPPPLAARPGRETRETAARSSRTATTGNKPSMKRIRTWKDRTGQFKVDAEFLGMNGSKIRLHKVNGVTIEVPMEKMSAEDLAYLKKVNSRHSTHADDTPAMQEDRRNRHHLRAEAAASNAGHGESTSTSHTASAAKSARPKKQMDWFDFFLNAGCDVDDCTRYGTNFDREKIEEGLVVDLEASNLRTLGLREGDIIRVLKYVKEKYGPPPTPEKGDREAQLAADAAMARSIAGPTPPPPNLFTNADGGLKTRRGRPTANRQLTSGSVDAATLISASSELAKRGGTPPISRVASPPMAAEPPKRSSSTIPQLGGFDDDAWTVKESAKSAASASAAAAPAPAPVPPPAPTPPLLPVSTPQRAGSAGPPASQGLTYNDGLLAQLGIGPRPPSAPATTGQPNGGAGYSTSPVNAFNPNAPRPPIAPIAANQALLAPLIPTPTGFGASRGQFGQGPLMANMTGYPGMGMSPAPLAPTFTGMPMQSQPQHFAGMQAPLQMQPTGYAQPQPQQSFLQPQATGFLQPQGTGIFQQQQRPASSPMSFNPAPARFSPAPPVQFNPAPPPSQAPPASSTTAQFQPNNVFASMKDGSFAKPVSQLGPQDPGKYDALRPQPTGFPQQGLQPQMTGAFGMLQPQQTGYPGQQMQQPLYSQQTGMPTGFSPYGQRQF